MKRMHGVTVAMITPFTDSDQVDLDYLKRYTEYLIQSGVHCLYPCGTTGEMLKLSVNERKLIAKTVVDVADGRIPVFIHVGAMTLHDTLSLARHALEIGSDGVGIVTPQFFSVTDREMEEYFITIANSLPENFPVYLYCIPQCAANDITPIVVNNILRRTKNVVGIKYSYADMVRVKDYLLCNDGNLDVVFGPDRLLLPAMAMGCVGTVSGCANCGPKPFVRTYEAYTKGDFELARKEQKKATELCELVKNGSNMAIFKAVMEFNGLPNTHMRAPALDLSDSEIKKLHNALQSYNIKYNDI